MIKLGISLKEGKVLNERQLAKLARQLQEESDDTQEDTAALLKTNQGQVSKALSGEREYRKTCIEIIAHYSEYEVECPLFRLKRKTSTE